jgi:hypothetical protein
MGLEPTMQDVLPVVNLLLSSFRLLISVEILAV